MDESLIVEIWDTFKQYIPEKNRNNAAEQYVDWLLGKEFTSEDLEGYLGYDPHLDDAISAILEGGEYEEDEEYDQEDGEDY
jgi:hypothetical protein